MSELNAPEERLAALEERWEAENSPSVFLPLVEEYRRLGRAEDALRVLETGLAAHPGHLSALVAKARCLLDLGRADAALRPLQEVMRQDATHMVAAKLLVEAHLRRGDTVQARQALEIYEKISPADPEATQLRQRIAGLQLEDTTTTEVGADTARIERPTVSRARSGRPDPFEFLHRDSDRERYLRAWQAGEIFAIGPSQPVTTAAADESRDEAEESPAAMEPFPGLDQPPPKELPEEVPFVVSPPVASPPSTPMPDEPAAAQSEVGEAESTAPEPPAATATLGRLYLSQGHEDEAEKIFRRVLEREPAHPGALAGLAELEARRSAVPSDGTGSTSPPSPSAGRPIPARRLVNHLIGDLPSDAPLARRKAELLRRYLGLLRSGGRQDHVS